MKTDSGRNLQTARYAADSLLQVNNTCLTKLQPLVILVKPCVTILIGVPKMWATLFKTALGFYLKNKVV